MQPNSLINAIQSHDRPIHDWYRFVLSFPPHLVRNYLTDFEIKLGHIVLDPFCGTGTTLIECKKCGVASVGVEANPLTHFVSSVKLDWRPDPLGLIQHATEIAHQAHDRLSLDGLDDNHLLNISDAKDYVAKTHTLRTFSPDTKRIVLSGSISPIPLHKTLTLLHTIQAQPDSPYRRHEQLGLIACAVREWSNLRFAPEVGIGRIKHDVRVVEVWLQHIRQMAFDLMTVQSKANFPSTIIHCADARQLEYLDAASISAVITSPPYPNEKDYTRTTRLEAALLGYIVDRTDLKKLKQALLRSNTRNVYVHDDDDQWIENFPSILNLAETIESRRVELGKTSGFERLYGRVTKLYFGGMARHLASLRRALKPGAMLAYVVGDQASYLQVMIRTSELLAEIAEALGYEIVRVDPFRTRLATATKAQLREEVLILRWRGK